MHEKFLTHTFANIRPHNIHDTHIHRKDTNIEFAKDPESMGSKEILAELREHAVEGTRTGNLINQLEFLVDYQLKELDRRANELRIANEKIESLKEGKEPEQDGEALDVLVDVGLDAEQVFAYCNGMSDAAEKIGLYVTSLAEENRNLAKPD